MQVIDPAAAAAESTGVVVDGIRRYPRARPIRMLRIFRTIFPSRESAIQELKSYTLLRRYLPAGSFAASTEILVDYRLQDRCDILLCGFQDFVEGGVVEPWSIRGPEDIAGMLADMARPGLSSRTASAVCAAGARAFIRRMVAGLKKMITDAGHIPDLAGLGNIKLTPEGRLILVDINNISRVHTDDRIHLDDKGYPAADKSIQALFILETRLLGEPVSHRSSLYDRFLAPDRMAEVDAHVRVFRERTESSD